MSHPTASEKEKNKKLCLSMACSANQSQLPGPVSSESGKERRKWRNRGTHPHHRGNPLSCCYLCKAGLLLTQITSTSWKALSCGKASLTLVSGSVAWTAPSFVRNPLVSLQPRDVLRPPPDKQSEDLM